MGGRSSSSNIGSGVNVSLTEKRARRIQQAAWGEDAIPAVLNSVSSKLNAFDDVDGSSWDVSYEGSRSQLINEMLAVYQAAGIDAKKGERGIIYDNDGMEVHVGVVKEDDDDYTFTEKSHHYGVYVENREG